MFTIFMTSLRYSFTEKANKTLYNLNKLPFLKKIIGDRFYQSTEGKNAFGIIGFIFNLIGKFFGYVLLIFLGTVLPAQLINKYMGYGPEETVQLQILFVINVCTSFLISSIFNSDNADYNMIKLMRVNPKEYYLSKITIGIQDDILFLIALYIFKISNPIFLTLEFIAISILGEYVQIFLFDKFGFILCKTKAVNIILWIFSIVAGYIPCIFGLIYDFNIVIESPIFLIASIIMALISFIQMKKYNGYKDIVLNINLKSSVIGNIEELNSDITFGDVKISNVEGKLLDSSQFSNKTGYEYLNSIFFFRNSKLVKRAIKFKCILITIVMIILIVITLITKDEVEETFDFIKNCSPYLFFIMYFISSTERLCKAMFFNCDLSLLRYGFYKREEDILKNFKSRLKKMLFYNSIPTFTLVIQLSILVFIMGKGGQFIEVIPTLISIVSLSGFFTLYGVFMYYILQPYTKSLEVKSPVFSICNFIIFVISYACLKIKTASYIFTLAIIVVTLIFIPISIFCIYKYAPKTFKLK